MLNFEKVILHNFGSYQHTEVNLQNRGFCLVTGQNLFKKDNAQSNGSGKSFLWNAICYALVGETIGGLHTNLKNINVEDDPTCYVTLHFSEGNDYYVITRHIAPKSDLKIIRNDIDLSGKGIRESEKKLSELLPDLTKNLIASTIIIGQGMPNKFSSFSPSGRKELLEKLTRADFMIEDIKQRVTTRLTELSTATRLLEDARLAKQSQLNVHNTMRAQKTSEQARLVKPDFEAQIAAQTDIISNIERNIETQSLEVADLDTKLSELSIKLFNLNTAKSTELDAIKAEADQASYSLVQQQATLRATHSGLRAQILQFESIKDTCPTCGQHIPGAHKPDTSGMREELASLAKELASVSEALDAHQVQYQKNFTAISAKYELETNESQKAYQEIRASLTTVKSNLKNLEQTRSSEQQKMTKLIYDRAAWDDRYAALSSEILSLEASCANLSSELSLIDADLVDRNEHLKVVRKMDTLIKRDFRGFLLANIISYIDKKAKDYCEIVFGTRDLEVALDGNDLNISYCGKVFDNLSGGEKQRVDLILQFAIRNMLTVYLNFNANILVLDEITDFLDKKSCAAILKLIEQELNTIESVFIISHHASALALPIDSELVIKKNESGISDIVLGV